MSSPPAAAKPTPDDELRAANTAFYAAFESLDLEQMDGVWSHDDGVQCVHPGWDLLMGWDEVRDRWARIFAGARRVRVALSGVWVRIEENVGWVACTEHITTAFADGFDDTTAQATNIFVRLDGTWQMVVHHSSPLPNPDHSTVQ